MRKTPATAPLLWKNLCKTGVRRTNVRLQFNRSETQKKTDCDPLLVSLLGLRVGLAIISVTVVAEPSLRVDVKVDVIWAGAVVIVDPRLFVVVSETVLWKVVLKPQNAQSPFLEIFTRGHTEQWEGWWSKKWSSWQHLWTM